MKPWTAFRQRFKRFSDECRLRSLSGYTEYLECLPAAAMHARSL